MIISRTPFRISFLGGGTDYPRWYRHHGGAVIATTIDKYCYLTCRYLPPFFEHRIRVVYSKIENCQTVDEVSHPSVREALKFLQVTRGVEIHHDGDLPARSGMGSSSAFTVGLLHALHALEGRMVSKHQLATEGIHVEQELLHETVGSQDQVATAYGGLNHIRFLPSGEISVRPIIMSADRLSEFNSWLMLFYTGIKRTASGVASTYVEDIEDRRRSMRILQDLVEEGLAVLSAGKDLRHFGELLHEAWLVKRGSRAAKSPTSGSMGSTHDAMDAGAIGGKLLGAGGGGFMMLFVPPDRHEQVQQKFDRLIHVPFKFESRGSEIVFFEPETDYSNEDLARQAIPHREVHGTLRRSGPFRRVNGGCNPWSETSRIYVAGSNTLIGAAILRRVEHHGYTQLCNRVQEEVDLTAAREVDAYFQRVRPEYVFFAAGKSRRHRGQRELPGRPDAGQPAVQHARGRFGPPHGVRKLLYLASSCSYPKLCPQPMRVADLISGPAGAHQRGLCRGEARRHQAVPGLPAAVSATTSSWGFRPTPSVRATISAWRIRT